MKKADQLDLLEKEILAACFNGKLPEIIWWDLKADDFFNADYGVIFTAILKNEVLGCACTIAEVASHLAESANLLPKLVECDETRNTTLNPMYALRIVKNASKRRKLLCRMWDLYQAAVKMPLADDYDLESQIAALLTDQDIASKTEYTHKQLTTEVLDDIQADIDAGGVKAIKTGITKLDRHLGGGLKPGKLITIAARPGCGKTALATNIALSAAKEGSHPLYITLELNSKEIVERLICTDVDINTNVMSSRTFDADDLDRFIESINRISKLEIAVNSTTGGSWEKAEIEITLECKYHKCDIVLIDYIQQFHVTSTSKRLDIRQEMTHITSRCKQLAMLYQVPIIIVAQLNREIEKRASKIPQLSDLKESGSIEQDSDAVIMLYEIESHDGQMSEQDGLWMKIAKNRSGQVGVIKMRADLSTNKFYSGYPNDE